MCIASHALEVAMRKQGYDHLLGFVTTFRAAKPALGAVRITKSPLPPPPSSVASCVIVSSGDPMARTIGRVGPLFSASVTGGGGPSTPERTWSPNPWERNLRRTVTGWVETVLDMNGRKREPARHLHQARGFFDGEVDSDQSFGAAVFPVRSDARGPLPNHAPKPSDAFTFSGDTNGRYISNFDLQ
jgi:hypothetical protein